jgi:hypothetical protein
MNPWEFIAWAYGVSFFLLIIEIALLIKRSRETKT